MSVVVLKDPHLRPLVFLFQECVYYTQAGKRMRRHSQLPRAVYQVTRGNLCILSTDNLSFFRR